jgi:hypothetical protein
MTLADILAALAEISDPEQLTTTIDELLANPDIDLAALQEELSNRAAELTVVEPADMTDEQIAEAELVAQLIAIVTEKIDAGTEGEEAAAEEPVTEAAAEPVAASIETTQEDQAARTERAKAAAQKLADASAVAKTPTPQPAQPVVAVQEVAPPEQPIAPEPVAVPAVTDIAAEAVAPVAEQKVEVALEPVPAAANPPAATDGRRETVPLTNVIPAPTAQTSADPRRIKHTIVAAGDLPGYRAGQELNDMAQVSAAVQTGMTMVSRSQAPGIQQQLASIRREAPDHLFYAGEGDHVKVDAVTDVRNLPGGEKGLIAAGGWCAPSEFIYDTCPITVSRDGMVDLPTITASRGGIKYSGKPDFSAIWQNVGFIQTEVDAIAGVLKPCYEIPCPADLDECRMDISGICLKQPILTERGWPEKVAEFVELAMLAHAHKMNAERIRRMAALATYSLEVPAPAFPQEASIFDPHGPGAFESVLSVLELQVEFFRYSGRLARNATLEAIAPYWFRGILRADISKKLGIDDRWGAGADAALDRWFADRGVRFQYVYDWQDAMADQDDTSFGGAVPTQWPEQVQILLFEPGTFFGLQQDVINLSGVYDSVDLQRNVYTRLFTEEGFAVCTRCGRSMLLTLNLCPNGLSGTHQRTQCAPVTP